MTDKCYECGGSAPEGWEMCPVCSVRAKLPDRPDELPISEEEKEMVVTVPACVESHEAPHAILNKNGLMVFRNGQFMQPGEHNDYVLDRAHGRVKWNVPLTRDDQVCIFCPADGARWAWSPQCGVFVDIRR